MGMAFCALDDLIWDVHITRTPFFSYYPSTFAVWRRLAGYHLRCVIIGEWRRGCGEGSEGRERRTGI
jgi:hypothetical protein